MIYVLVQQIHGLDVMSRSVDRFVGYTESKGLTRVWEAGESNGTTNKVVEVEEYEFDGPQKALEPQQNNRINELELLILDLKADLIMRARKDSGDLNVVNLSSSLWHRMNKAITQI